MLGAPPGLAKLYVPGERAKMTVGRRGYSQSIMPFYDYRCHKCGETFEVKQKFADEPLQVHEGCGGSVERLISVPALQFKGTGWYVTDYGRGGKSPASNGPTSSTPAKAESKTESKPAAKPESPKSTSDK
jgi:putative FmdB family regulatory protein